jgi:hypothetical protein
MLKFLTKSRGAAQGADSLTDKEFNTIFDMLQRLADALLGPFGYAAHVVPEAMSLYGPPAGRRYTCERTQEPDALFLWLGPVHMVFDRGR